MGVTGLLRRAGAARPHVLVAAVPGGTALRLAAEQELRRRGWPAALAPADADVLLVAGAPAEDIAGAVQAAWAAMPEPRARTGVNHPGEVAAALDAARAELASTKGQRFPAVAGGAHHGHGSTSGHQEHGMGGGHHGHDMGGMEMPGGLPMAERAEDRDGLKLDQLHVPLGPVLADWPAGLMVHLALQGDVVQHAETDAVGLAAGGSFWAEPWSRAAAGEPVSTGAAARRLAAAHLDSLARFLGVAGWDDAAAAARRLRDGALSGAPRSWLRPGVRRFAARVARSRMLAWSTRGIGMLPPGDAAAAGVSGPALRAAGDVTARYRRWCGELADAIALLDDGSPLDTPALEPPRGRTAAGPGPSAALLAILPRLLVGAEFAAARLIVASLDPDLDELPAPVEASGGR